MNTANAPFVGLKWCQVDVWHKRRRRPGAANAKVPNSALDTNELCFRLRIEVQRIRQVVMFGDKRYVTFDFGRGGGRFRTEGLQPFRYYIRCNPALHTQIFAAVYAQHSGGPVKPFTVHAAYSEHIYHLHYLRVVCLPHRLARIRQPGMRYLSRIGVGQMADTGS